MLTQFCPSLPVSGSTQHQEALCSNGGGGQLVRAGGGRHVWRGGRRHRWRSCETLASRGDRRHLDPSATRSGRASAGRRGVSRRRGRGERHDCRHHHHRLQVHAVRLHHGGLGGVSAAHPAAPGGGRLGGRGGLAAVHPVRRLLRLGRLAGPPPLHHAPATQRAPRPRRQRRRRILLVTRQRRRGGHDTRRLPVFAAPGGGRELRLPGVRAALRQAGWPEHTLPHARHGLHHCTQEWQTHIEEEEEQEERRTEGGRTERMKNKKALGRGVDMRLVQDCVLNHKPVPSYS